MQLDGYEVIGQLGEGATGTVYRARGARGTAPAWPLLPPERDDTRRKLLSGESRIVVCVDMLGEGFDLPELKIAAFHDIRRTLAVAPQPQEGRPP